MSNRMPQARRIPLSRRSHIIGFQSLPTGATEHESVLERDFVTRTCFIDPTALIRSQPVTIAYEEGGRRRRYTPDFLLRGATGTALVEVKYEIDLRAQQANLMRAFRAAERWAQDHSACFRVVTECDIRDGVLKNAKRLLPLRARALDTRMAMLVLTRAHAMKGATFRELLAELPDRDLALATIWQLLARRSLLVDLSSPVRLDSELQPA